MTKARESVKYTIKYYVSAAE